MKPLNGFIGLPCFALFSLPQLPEVCLFVELLPDYRPRDAAGRFAAQWGPDPGPSFRCAEAGEADAERSGGQAFPRPFL